MHRCASGGRNGWRAIAETSNALRPLSPPGRDIRPAGDSRPGHGDPRQIERFRSRGFQGAGADLAGPARMPGAREPAEWKSPRSSYRHRRRKSALDETSNRGAQEAAVGPVPDPEPRGVVRFILRYRRRGSQRLDYCAAGGGPGKDPEPARRCRRSGISHCCRFSPFGRTRCVDRDPVRSNRHARHVPPGARCTIGVRQGAGAIPQIRPLAPPGSRLCACLGSRGRRLHRAGRYGLYRFSKTRVDRFCPPRYPGAV